jgi:hypothetical protein
MEDELPFQLGQRVKTKSGKIGVIKVSTELKKKKDT